MWLRSENTFHLSISFISTWHNALEMSSFKNKEILD